MAGTTVKEMIDFWKISLDRVSYINLLYVNDTPYHIQSQLWTWIIMNSPFALMISRVFLLLKSLIGGLRPSKRSRPTPSTCQGHGGNMIEQSCKYPLISPIGTFL